jgi:hypothetical protein
MGTYTLKELLQITHKYYQNRYDYKRRDVVKRVTVKQIRTVDIHDQPNEPRIRTKYEIISKSYPQYRPYFTGVDRRGIQRRYQRSIAHYYDIIIEIDRLSINTKNWRGRVGSGKRWEPRPPQKQIKSLYSETRERFRRRANKRNYTNAQRQAAYKKLVEIHRRGAKFLDVGDWNSRVKGLNGDFIFRCDFAWWSADHRFGRNYYGNVPAKQMNRTNIVFAPKHFLNVVEVLMNAGVLKND